MAAKMHNGTAVQVGSTMYTLHDEPGATIVRVDGAMVGYWVRTDERSAHGCAAFILVPATLPTGREIQATQRVGRRLFRTLPAMVEALHRARRDAGLATDGIDAALVG